jgi:DMSO reductase anchor subunit
MSKIKHSLLYFIAAGLAAIAAVLSLINEGGIELRMVAGSVIGLVMLWLGVKARREGN